MELDLEGRLMGETLVINRSLDPFLEDYIELNYLNEPLELRRNQEDDLMPTIKEGEVIEEFRIRNEDLDTGINDYPRALMNVPIFVGTFSVMTDFAVLENIDAYRDEGMGDVIFSKPFLREADIKAKRVLYKVEDIATCLVKYVKFWDDWEVDRYGNANLGRLKANTFRNAGFMKFKIHHAGGLWIWIQFPSSSSADNFQTNASLKGIYSYIKTATPSLKVDKHMI
ncbi:hypothetical protein Tco_0588693 [Tanacetum coccineum]